MVAILTRDDLKDINPFYGNCLRDRPLVALDKVRFVGEPVAVVAAEDLLIAEEALALIDVRYHELPCLGRLKTRLPPALRLCMKAPPAPANSMTSPPSARDAPNVCHHEFLERRSIRGFTEADKISRKRSSSR